MGVQHNYGTVGATGGGFATLATLQPCYEENLHEPRWSMQQRAPKTARDPYAWISVWSFGLTTFGTTMDYLTVRSSPDVFEPYSCGGEGNQSMKFLKGVCRDVGSSPLSGVVLQGFRTSDDASSGYEVQSRSDGSYDLPTNFPSVAHYVVAYLAGSPDRAGTTVNTLVPTNVDGS